MLLIGTIAIILIWVTSVNAEVQLTERSKLAIDGIGPIRVGMTVAEASRSAGVTLVKKYRVLNEETCAYFAPQGEPKGIEFMVTKHRIARVDISNKQVTTIKGAKIGDSEERIFSLYPGQIKATQHPYARPPVRKQYLIFIPRDPADKNYQIIFETENNAVRNFRAGKLPEVGYIEGCS